MPLPDATKQPKPTHYNWGKKHILKQSAGAEARAIMTNAEFDVLVCDIAMPDEDGYEVSSRIRTLETQRRAVFAAPPGDCADCAGAPRRPRASAGSRLSDACRQTGRTRGTGGRDRESDSPDLIIRPPWTLIIVETGCNGEQRE